MPRDGRPARLRLRQAALDLYGQCRFDQVTTAEIAARAGVTERTFYRHFADKREVLFDGEATLRDALVAGLAGAPEALAPLPALLWCFRTTVPLLEENRPYAESLHRLIETTPAVCERAQAKTAALTRALATTLRERGTPEPTASLAAQLGMAAFGHASDVWFCRSGTDLDRLFRDAFEGLHALAAPLSDVDGFAPPPAAHPDAGPPPGEASPESGGP
jgi:AcrR family transcriptional regulator